MKRINRDRRLTPGEAAVRQQIEQEKPEIKARIRCMLKKGNGMEDFGRWFKWIAGFGIAAWLISVVMSLAFIILVCWGLWEGIQYLRG